MRLIFPGTRGNTQLKSRLHRMHASLIVDGGGGRVLIDCGADWGDRVVRLRPVAVLVSHAHDDHAAGLKAGAPCAVYASADAWQTMARWPLATRCVVPPRHQFALAGLIVEAWPVEHSVRAPAVGYRLTAGPARMFYVPDVAHLPNPAAALRNVDLYVGDGATIERPLVRWRGALRIGHATIRTQLEWCAASGVANAIFTHCGSAIVRADPREIARVVDAMGREQGVSARIAYDGFGMTLESRRRTGPTPAVAKWRHPSGHRGSEPWAPRRRRVLAADAR